MQQNATVRNCAQSSQRPSLPKVSRRGSPFATPWPSHSPPDTRINSLSAKRSALFSWLGNIKRRYGRIALALIIANEIRGVIVVVGATKLLGWW